LIRTGSNDEQLGIRARCQAGIFEKSCREVVENPLNIILFHR
jgi:hypothetical protein